MTVNQGVLGSNPSWGAMFIGERFMKNKKIEAKQIYTYRKWVLALYHGKKIQAFYWNLKYKYYLRQENKMF